MVDGHDWQQTGTHLRPMSRSWRRSTEELAFSVGDKIILQAKDESGWWLGKLDQTGVVGWFAPDLVVPLNESEPNNDSQSQSNNGNSNDAQTTKSKPTKGKSKIGKGKPKTPKPNPRQIVSENDI